MSLKSESGLTLVELLVVIGLMAIVFSFLTYLRDTYRQSVIIKIRDDVLSTLERARTLSITSVPHGFKCLGDKFSLVGLKDGRCHSDNDKPCYNDNDCDSGDRCEAGDYRKTSDEDDRELESHTSPVGHSLCCISSCSNYTIWFDRKGIPRDASWGLGMTTVKINSINKDSITTVSITISPFGRIQYEKR